MSGGGCDVLSAGERIQTSPARGAVRARQPCGNRQGAVARPDHASRSVQVGPVHRDGDARAEARPQPVRTECLRGQQRADRHAAQSSVRGAEVHPGDAAVGVADAGTDDPQAGRRQSEQRRGRVLDVAERTPGQAPFLSHRLHRQSCRPAVQESADRQRPDRGPAAGRGVRAPALERVLSQGRLRLVMGRRRAEQPSSTRISRPRRPTASGPTEPAHSCRARCRRR